MSDVSGLQWTDVVYELDVKRRSDKLLHRKATDPSAEIEKGDEAPQTTKRILNGLSGHVDRGEFVGILGASGAGKTTLLNALSARMDRSGHLSGQILFDGKVRSRETWARTVGYVQQDDALLPRSTVRESIETAAKLRLSDKLFSPQEKQDRAEDVMSLLRLENCAETQVGNEAVRGVSGGERKRTSIAIELVSEVSMLFLDEPTSGLDSFAAQQLINTVHQIVKDRQMACLMTIHQPSWAVFTKLDRVILLAKDGVYYDGLPREATAWFAGLGCDVPEGVNPADYFISIAETDTVDRLLSGWKDKAKRASSISDSGEKSSTDARVAYPTTIVKEFTTLFARWWRETARDKPTIIATAGQTLVILILIGFSFFRLGDSQDDVLPKIGVMFFIPINSSFSTTFPVQRALIKRERASGLYRASTAFFSKAALELPSNIIPRLPFYIILYFMVGLRLSAGAFFVYLGINCLYLANSVALALMVAALSPTLEISQIIAPLFNVIFLLFGGSLLPTPPPWFIWLKWVSPITYIFSATLQNEFAGAAVACDAAGSAQCYQNGDAVIQAYNAGTFNIGEDAGFLAGITVIYFVLGWLALKWSTGPRFRII